MSIEDLMQTSIFSGIAPEDISELLHCIDAKRVDYAKDEFIIEEGGTFDDFIIFLSGHGRTLIWDMNGKVITYTLLTKGSVIGVMLAAIPGYKSPVAVQAQDDVSVLLIPYNRITDHCKRACRRHEKLLHNYIYTISQIGLELQVRINCLLKPTIREKVLTFLKKLSHEQQSKTFSIPINRNEMAEYLNVERSALSRELSSMKRDGLIDYYKNSFKLY
ncbi:MAG: Crp/Fnr family transcriptional regulator [Oscillospiraceae bacterium]|nr:Crp/Fnr family transcriptional regulator [Oscillospiraceae bacterium]